MLILQVVTLFSLIGSACSKDLLVGAFNIQVFGDSKVKKAEVMAILVKIIRRYDLIFIQEIREPTGEAIAKLLNDVNQGQTDKFEMVLSERIGRSRSKEQYAYFYKPSSGLQVKEKFVYHDTKVIAGKAVDLFQRQPYVVSFTSSQTELDSFALIGIHVAPKEAVEEINYLRTFVVDDVKNRLREPNLMIMGDLNADCNYVSKTKWRHISMKTDKSFKWWIGDDADTTVKKTHCAYDRFITTGTGWEYGIVKNSAKVYKFDEDVNYLGKIDPTLAAEVSDHYPIEFLLAETQYYAVSVSYRLYVKLYAEKGGLQINEFYAISPAFGGVVKVYDDTGSVVGELQKDTADDIALSDKLIWLMDRVGSSLEVYVEPLKGRYSRKQNSQIVIPIQVTEKSKATLIWNALNDVCETTYFKCSKSGF